MIRIRFWGILYYNDIEEPQNSILNYAVEHLVVIFFFVDVTSQQNNLFATSFRLKTQRISTKDGKTRILVLIFFALCRSLRGFLLRALVFRSSRRLKVRAGATLFMRA